MTLFTEEKNVFVKILETILSMSCEDLKDKSRLHQGSKALLCCCGAVLSTYRPFSCSLQRLFQLLGNIEWRWIFRAENGVQ